MNKLITVITTTIALAFTMPLVAQDMEDTITVTSSIFDHHGMVPEENSAYGANTSIDLSWANLPAGTQSLALICDDPKVVEIGMMELKEKKKMKKNEIEYANLKKEIFEEATNVRIDYEQNPNSIEESGSVVVIHQNSPFLDKKYNSTEEWDKLRITDLKKKYKKLKEKKDG